MTPKLVVVSKMWMMVVVVVRWVPSEEVAVVTADAIAMVVAGSVVPR